MKLYKISQILKYRFIKSNSFITKKRIYNDLYNDYKSRSSRKENMRMNQFYNESQLYPFTPVINSSGYMTFRPSNYRSSTPYNSSKYSFYSKNNPINQKWSTFTEPYRLKKNILTENNLNDSQNYNDYNNIHDYPFIYPFTNRNNQFENSESNPFNRTDYGFYTPSYRHKKKNIFSDKDENINTQIYEYLNNFQNNKKRINSLYPYKPNNRNNFVNRSDIRDRNLKKRNRVNDNIGFGNNYNIKGKGKSQIFYPYKNLYNENYKKGGEIENYFNKRTSNKYNNKKNNKYNDNLLDKKSNKLNTESNDFFCSFNKEYNNINNSKKNSNTSLNPSSLGIDHLKTFYTNIPKSSNNLNKANSNLNSASSRVMDIHTNFLKKLKMTSGEVNEYFYDFNPGRKDIKDKNDDQKSVQSLQSLSDSKMMELANHYVSGEEDSVENYQMNNVIYSKKKHNAKH